MGDGFIRRTSRLCAAIFGIAALCACAPVFDAARDAVQSIASPAPNPIAVRQSLKMATLLDARFRPGALKTARGESVGHVRCPMRIYAEDIVPCSIRIGKRDIPILATWNAADKHLDSAYGLSAYPRPVLENAIAARIESEYGDFPKIACAGPNMIWSIPGSQLRCAVETPSQAGRTVKAQFLDTGGWIVLLADPEPADEREIAAAYAQTHGTKIPGKMVARVILRRDARLMHRANEPYALDNVVCPKFMNLAAGHRASCGLKVDGEFARENVLYTNGRLAFRVDGAVVQLDRVRANERAALRKTYHTAASADISIDCAADHVVVVTYNAYHWCEINGPARYPKRLVITSLDHDGHYDVFFSNFSQSAWER